MLVEGAWLLISSRRPTETSTERVTQRTASALVALLSSFSVQTRLTASIHIGRVRCAIFARLLLVRTPSRSVSQMARAKQRVRSSSEHSHRAHMSQFAHCTEAQIHHQPSKQQSQLKHSGRMPRGAICETVQAIEMALSKDMSLAAQVDGVRLPRRMSQLPRHMSL